MFNRLRHLRRAAKPEYTGSVLTSTEALTNRERLALFRSKRDSSAQKPSARDFSWLEVIGGTIGGSILLAAALAFPFALSTIMGVSA